MKSEWWAACFAGMVVVAIVLVLVAQAVDRKAEVEIRNLTGSPVELLISPGETGVDPIAMLAHGETHTAKLEPGSWWIAAMSDDARMGMTTDTLHSGEVVQLAFRCEHVSLLRKDCSSFRVTSYTE